MLPNDYFICMGQMSPVEGAPEDFDQTIFSIQKKTEALEKIKTMKRVEETNIRKN
jgi:hypothetical protein